MNHCLLLQINVILAKEVLVELVSSNVKLITFVSRNLGLVTASRIVAMGMTKLIYCAVCFYFVLFYAWLNMQGGKQWILKTSYLVYYIMVYHNAWLRLYFRQQNLQFDYRISMSKQTLYTEVMALRSKTWLHSRCRWKKLYWIM